MMEVFYSHIPELLLKTTILLLIAFGLCRLFKHRSAAFRSQIWVSAMLFALILPLFMLWLPSLNLASETVGSINLPVSHLTGDNEDLIDSYLNEASENGNGFNSVSPLSNEPTLELAFNVWGAGSLIMLVFAFRQRRMGRKLLERAVIADDVSELVANDVVLPSTAIYYSEDLVTPVALGIRRPVILLPTSSRYWEQHKLFSAILHEQAHVENGDNLARAIALLTRCFLWFHPLAWLGFNRLKEEQEKAADDKVINSGVRASSYAKDLLDIVKSINGQDGQKGLVSSMGSYSFFPQRMKAILADNQDRSAISSRNKLTIIGISMLISLPIAAVTAASNTSGFQSIPGTLLQIAESELTVTPVMPLDSEDAFYANGAVLSAENSSQLLLSAARRTDRAMLELLFESGVKASAKAQNEMLTQAINRADIGLLHLYLEAGLSLENTDQALLLRKAVERSDLKMTALLLLAGVDVSRSEMQSLLRLVEQRSDKKMMVLLLEAEQFR